MSVYDLTFNEAKCKVVHIRKRKKTKAWKAAMKPMILLANMQPSRCLGLTTAVEVLKRGFKNISKSMPQQRLFALRTGLTPRLIHELCSKGARRNC